MLNSYEESAAEPPVAALSQYPLPFSIVRSVPVGDIVRHISPCPFSVVISMSLVLVRHIRITRWRITERDA